MTEEPRPERTYERSAYTRSWLRNGGRACNQFGWLVILVGVLMAAVADAGDTPVYLAPAIAGVVLIGLSVWLVAEAER